MQNSFKSLALCSLACVTLALLLNSFAGRQVFAVQRAGSAALAPGAWSNTPGTDASLLVLTVVSAGDEGDLNPGDAVCVSAMLGCTLRAALEEANARPGPEQIRFDIRNPDGSCPELVTIRPAKELLIDDPLDYGVLVDGYSQCGAAPNTAGNAGNAQIKIELLGAGSESLRGLSILSANNTLRGLAIYNFAHQLRLTDRARFNRIQGNFIGTNAANSFSMSSASYGDGIVIRYGAAYNVVGCGSFSAEGRFLACQDPAEWSAARNIIAGNGLDGVRLRGTVEHNHVVGNYIGLRQDGSTALPNASDGVDIEFGAANNWIGGPEPGAGNVISGNGRDGIEISHESATQLNQIVGNLIGLDASGTAAAGNGSHGISLEDGVSHNTIAANTIGNNGGNGIRFYVNASRNQVLDNLIGVAPDGQTAMPNGANRSTIRGRNGIYVLGGSQHNLIRGNTIAYHPEHGVLISNQSDVLHNVYGESYYNTISQNSSFHNHLSGIALESASNPETGRSTTANEGLPAPLLSSATMAQVTGSTCAGCRVELFIADKRHIDDPAGDNSGEGWRFLNAALADAAGRFVITADSLAADQIITATATDGRGNTSSFSANLLVAPASGPAEPPACAEHCVWLPLINGGSG